MKSKTVLVLVVVVALLAAAAAVLLGPGKDDARKTALGQKAFPDLPFEKIEKIRIISRNGAATVARQPRGWGVVEKSGYPADFSKISELVEKLRSLKVGRSFSADAEVKDRLSLHPPSEAGVAAEKSATRLVLFDDEDRPLADLLIGRTRESDRGFGGHYVMHRDRSEVLLVDKTFKFLSAAPEEWLHLQVIDLDVATIEKVAFYRSGKDSPAYELIRPKKGEDFTLAGTAPKPIDPAKTGRVTGALSPLSAENVLSAEADAGQKISFAGADRFVYTTFDGRNYRIELGPSFSREEETFTYARLNKTPAGEGEKPDEYRGWIYVLSKWKAEDFITSREGLLAKNPEDG